MLEIEIDGKKAQVPDGSTVMDAAQQLGVYIPHFCYHKKLSIAANCRMCLVQVEKAPKPLPACATPVTNGMKVFTHSELALKAQKGVMEFLLINHPLDCPICDQGGECQLQDMSVGYGPMKSRYTEEKRVVFHKNIGPLVSMEEMSRCIHCTRCVRFGQEVAGVMELGMANRNMHSEITTFVGRTVDSELSGNMIDLCPVGALTSKPFRYTARAWELQRRKTISPHDSVGANLVAQVKHDNVYRVLPRENEAVNECWISDKERFSYLGLSAENRIQKPMLKQGGAWQEVEWNVAIDYVAHALNDLKTEFGPKALAGLASPSSTLEELALFSKIFRGLGVEDVEFRTRHANVDVDSYRKGIPWLGMKLAEIADQDSILVVGSFLRKDHPLLAQRIRQAAKKFTSVNSISCTGENQLINFEKNIVVSPTELSATLAGLVKAVAAMKQQSVSTLIDSALVNDEIQKIAQSLCEGDKSAIFMGNVVDQVADTKEIVFLVQKLAEMTGSSFGHLGSGANSVGGYVAKAVAQNSVNAIFSSHKKGFVLLGNEPELDSYNPGLAQSALNSAKFVVLMSPYRNDKALEYADVILPVSPFTETSGTYINIEGRVQSFQGVVRPLGNTRPAWKVLRVLGNVLNLEGFDYTSSEQIRDELLGQGIEFISGLDNSITLLDIPSLTNMDSASLIRIADVPIHFTDALVRRSSALRQTIDSRVPSLRLSSATATAINSNLKNEQKVSVSQLPGQLVSITVEFDETVPLGCVRLASGHEMTMQLGDMFGKISVECA